MTTLFVVRHAEKVTGGFFNPTLRHQDEPLTAAGRQQAARLVAYFTGRPVTALAISVYRRTRQTAEPLAGHFGLAPIVDERLNEIDNGVLDGMADQDIQRAYPEIRQAYTGRRCDFRFPGGETGAEAAQRLAGFLAFVRERRAGQTVIAVCHEGLMRLLACHVLGLPVYDRWKFKVDFCGICEFATNGETDPWRLIRFNQGV